MVYGLRYHPRAKARLGMRRRHRLARSKTWKFSRRASLEKPTVSMTTTRLHQCSGRCTWCGRKQARIGRSFRNTAERHPEGIHPRKRTTIYPRRLRCALCSTTFSSSGSRFTPKFSIKYLSISGYHIRESGSTTALAGAGFHSV